LCRCFGAHVTALSLHPALLCRVSTFHPIPKVGEPLAEQWGDATEPGGYISATAPVPRTEVERYMRLEGGYSNSRFAGVQKVGLCALTKRGLSVTSWTHMAMHSRTAAWPTVALVTRCWLPGGVWLASHTCSARCSLRHHNKQLAEADRQPALA
jgi:hypothetical protein